MDFSTGLSSVTAAQMQTRMAMSQAEHVLNQAKLEATEATDATQKAKTPEERAAAYKSLVKVSRDFESIFLDYMLKTMRQTIPKSDLFGDSQADQIFSSMRDEELSKRMAQAGGIGLANIMINQLKRHI